MGSIVDPSNVNSLSKTASSSDFNSSITEDALLNYAKLSYEIGNSFEEPLSVLIRFIETYPKNDEISGFENIPNNTNVFHAGTKNVDGRILTSGGRVLGVTALGETLQNAIENAYIANYKIISTSKYFRTDIGKKGLNLF